MTTFTDSISKLAVQCRIDIDFVCTLDIVTSYCNFICIFAFRQPIYNNCTFVPSPTTCSAEP